MPPLPAHDAVGRRRWEQDPLLVDSLEQLLPPQMSQPPPADWGLP